jgi:hypothetical protein
MSKEQERQLTEWVKGNPFHNDVDDECCPDFSCCRPELLAPEYERQAFANASEEKQMSFLMGYLGRAISTYEPSKKVHIVGDTGEEQ